MPRKMAREPSNEQLPDVPAPPNKISLVLSLLRSENGARLDELVQATSWLPHTTRAALTGLRKKGHVITKVTIEGVTRYSISEAAAQ